MPSSYTSSAHECCTPSMSPLEIEEAEDDLNQENDSISTGNPSEGLMKRTVLEFISKTASERHLIDMDESSENIMFNSKDDIGDLFEEIPAPYIDSTNYQKINISNIPDKVDEETRDCCQSILRCLELRKKWMGWSMKNDSSQIFPEQIGADIVSPGSYQIGRRRQELTYDPFSVPIPSSSDEEFKIVNGVIHVYEVDRSTGKRRDSPNIMIGDQDEYYNDLFELKRIIHSGPVKSLCYKRLQVLEARFNLHTLLNSDRELLAQKAVPHRDFYNIRKVDTHVHHSACMNQKHFLRYIKSKLKATPGEIVIYRDGRFMTLSEVFKSLHLTAYDLSIDTLDMHASNTFHRFDRFNLKYNPAGQSRLREIFLKTDNLIAGKYLAEVTKEVMSDLKASKYQLVEWRVSIYGRKKSEWEKLGRWFYVHRLSSPHVRWMIQIPRLYFLYKQSGEVENFQDMLDNIFTPLFEVSRNPNSNPPLHIFLQTVVGFDCVDDESKIEQLRATPDNKLPKPGQWNSELNPPYSYWCYYIYANIATLNAYRKARGLSTFAFRPHSGEAGDPEHLACTFLTADGINHGITLRKAAAIQYLFYLAQIGIAVSPLSNNKLFLEYHRNPFPVYFARGLNVSLSTDDPLMLHFTKDPLVEEYSVAAQVWNLSSTDICEIARNSVLQSGFEHPFKVHFLGENYSLPGAAGNDIRMTNVPDIRLNYRNETLNDEFSFVKNNSE